MVFQFWNQVLAEGSSREGKQPRYEALCEAPGGIENWIVENFVTMFWFENFIVENFIVKNLIVENLIVENFAT